jgi:hypothetical protein
MATRKPNDTFHLSDLCQRLRAVNHDAFTVEEYDVAYHALMAALHCVQTLKDVRGLGEIARTAKDQLAWIDSRHPEYDHSTQSSQKRGHPSIYHNLALQAETRVRMIETREAWHTLKGDKENLK